MAEFMFDWENTLYFKGIITLEEIDKAIWEEFLDLPTLLEVQQFYTLKLESHYNHWGRGMDDNGEFHQQMLYETNKPGRGSFMVTTIHYKQKQHSIDCQHSRLMKWNNEKQCNEELLTQPDHFSMNLQRECRLPGKGDPYFLDHNVCKICKDYQKKEHQ